MKKFCAFIACALIVASCFGCKKDTRPADLPDDMSPCKITITQDGQPVEGVTVELKYTTPVKYTTSGTTDATGVATMVTYGFAGAQQGTAKVRVAKLVTEGAVEADEDGKGGSVGEDFNVIDAQYGSFDTTPLEITVEKKNSVETFEVGPAVHDPVKKGRR